MDDEEEVLPVEDGAEQSLPDGGYIVTISDTSDPEQALLPVEEIRVLADRAATAVQPTDLASGAGADVEDLMLRSEHDTIVSALIARIEVLEAQISASLGDPYEANIYEAGVYEE
jgi:hypothetical protein